MKKVFITFLFLIGLPAFSATLTGGVNYTAEDALIELQNNKPSANFLFTTSGVDENYADNKSAILKGKTKLNDRVLAKFSDGSYGVNYYDNPAHVFYYDKDGTLINAEIKTSLDYPYKSYKYTPDGELVNMTMRVSEEETYIFSPLGQLLGHWLGSNCYDENGSVIMNRVIMK